MEIENRCSVHARTALYRIVLNQNSQKTDTKSKLLFVITGNQTPGDMKSDVEASAPPPPPLTYTLEVNGALFARGCMNSIYLRSILDA